MCCNFALLCGIFPKNTCSFISDRSCSCSRRIVAATRGTVNTSIEIRVDMGSFFWKGWDNFLLETWDTFSNVFCDFHFHEEIFFTQNLFWVCLDWPDFRDSLGYTCEQWVGHDCSSAVELWGLSQQAEDDILYYCCATCSTPDTTTLRPKGKLMLH